jgi:hypothetical protein
VRLSYLHLLIGGGGRKKKTNGMGAGLTEVLANKLRFVAVAKHQSLPILDIRKQVSSGLPMK